MKEAFSCKAPDWKPLCLLNITIKTFPDCPNKEHNAVFEQIHQNIYNNYFIFLIK